MENLTHIKYFWISLFYWYNSNKRDYPWRRTNNPYSILLAEFLLQQTNARKVEDVYRAVNESYPSPRHLMHADIYDLIDIIKPIGLTYRAERLILTAEQLCTKHGCFVPNSREDLLRLPGVGNYIADAVLCYAYNRPTVPIDTNVIRLFCRYFGLTSNRARARDDKQLAEEIRGLFVFSSTRTANLAVLDFASAVCRARTYSCDCCILQSKCSYS